ncbi:unnamed protein product [Rotaria sp. Silwood1]|nr:unnamed protein product [Rotaria sp. Silwood1]
MSGKTHSTCRSRVPEECGFGTLRDIIIPPYAISIPRIADLNKDLILGIGNNMSKPMQNITSQSNNNVPTGPDYIINAITEKNSGLPIMRCSSTEHQSGGDADVGMETVSSRPKREKPPSKGQQDEEEERGKDY